MSVWFSVELSVTVLVQRGGVLRGGASGSWFTYPHTNEEMSLLSGLLFSSQNDDVTVHPHRAVAVAVVEYSGTYLLCMRLSMIYDPNSLSQNYCTSLWTKHFGCRGVKTQRSSSERTWRLLALPNPEWSRNPPYLAEAIMQRESALMQYMEEAAWANKEEFLVKHGWYHTDCMRHNCKCSRELVGRGCSWGGEMSLVSKRFQSVSTYKTPIKPIMLCRCRHFTRELTI